MLYDRVDFLGMTSLSPNIFKNTICWKFAYINRVSLSLFC